MHGVSSKLHPRRKGYIRHKTRQLTAKVQHNHVTDRGEAVKKR
jgi:hypothetical protein